MSTLTQFGGGTTVGSIVPGLYPGNSRFLPCDGVSTTAVTSANSSLAKVYPLVTNTGGSHLTSNYYGFHAYSIAYGAGVWVAVGAGSSGSTEVDSGYCMTSTDLINWTPRVLPHNAVWRSVTWTGARFICVGADAGATSGFAAYSSDGFNWTTGGIPSGVMYRWVVSSGGRAFAMAQAGGTSYYSDDGGSWTNAGTVGIGVLAACGFKGRAYVTNGGSVNMKFTGGALSSGWNTVFSGSSLNCFACSPTTMVISSGAAGSTVTSTDGLTFTAQAGAPVLYSVIWDGTNFIGFGATNIYTSPTGVTWTIRTTDIFLSSSIRFIGATDGTTTAWVDWSNGHQHYSLTTNSGVAVTQRPFPRSGFNSTGNYSPMAYSSTLGLYVMGGMSDASYEPIPVMMTSTDGITWTERAVEMPAYNTLSNAGVQQIIWTGTAFIATNTSTGTAIWSSTDGINWRYKAGPAAGLMYITYGNSRALMMTTNGQYYTSTDNGTTWANQGAIGLTSVIGVVWNGTNFIAMNSSGAVSTSSTGVGSGWTAQSGSAASTYSNIGVVGTAIVATLSGGNSSFYYNTTNGTGSWTNRATPITITTGRISSDGTNMILSSNTSTNNQFLAFTSPSGTLTTVTTPRSIASANSITAFYANGIIFIPSYNNAVGGSMNTVFVSSNNGSTWAERSHYPSWNLIATSFASTNLSSTVFGGKAYFAAKYRPVIWSVEEGGTTFRARVLPLGSNNSPAPNYTTIGSNGSIMVAIGYDSNNIKTIISTSTDGINWTLRTTPAALPSTVISGAPTSWTNVLWNGTTFLATSNTFFGMTSTDGITWTLQYLPVQEVVTGGATYGAGNFFLSSSIPANGSSTTGYTSYYTSTDGATWAVKTSPAKYQNSSTAVWFASDGTTVMMMPHSQLSTASGVQYWTTTDGTNWTRGQVFGFGTALTNATQIVNYGGTFFAGNMASLDGKFWFSTGISLSGPIPTSSTTVFGFNNSGSHAYANIDTNTIKSPALNSTQTFVAPYYATSLVVA